MLRGAEPEIHASLMEELKEFAAAPRKRNSKRGNQERAMPGRRKQGQTERAAKEENTEGGGKEDENAPKDETEIPKLLEPSSKTIGTLETDKKEEIQSSNLKTEGENISEDFVISLKDDFDKPIIENFNESKQERMKTKEEPEEENPKEQRSSVIVEEKAASTKSEENEKEKKRGEEGMSIVDRIKNKVAHFILLNPTSLPGQASDTNGWETRVAETERHRWREEYCNHQQRDWWGATL